MAEKKPTAKNKPNELYIERIYNAPVKTVWEAWTDPAQAAKWWGPRGFTLTSHSKELRPGGQWKYTMHGPDGKDWPNIATYHEVEKHSRLVYDHGATETTPPLFRVTVTFEEIKGKTRMEMIMALPDEESAKQTKKFIKQAGGNGTWDRLAEYLGKETENKEKFFINRTFDAPIEKMFEVWTNPDHLAKWVPPTGFQMEYIEADIREGGNSFYLMFNDSGLRMYGQANYLKIEKPHRIVYTQQFCDEKRKVSRHPMAPTWPETMLTTVSLASEGPNSTRVTIEWEVVGHATAEEMETFIAGRAGMTQGWTGSFDKLEDYLVAT